MPTVAIWAAMPQTSAALANGCGSLMTSPSRFAHARIPRGSPGPRAALGRRDQPFHHDPVPTPRQPGKFRAGQVAAPTVSAMTAPRTPSGLSGPTVESREVWCSISELSWAPTRTTMMESHIHIIKPTTAPNAP
jgi:hypothetical protein